MSKILQFAFQSYTEAELRCSHFLCRTCTHTKKSLISSTFIRNPLPAAPLEYISLINDLIKNTCGIMKGVKFVPIQSDTFYLGASESRGSDIALAPRSHWSVMSYKVFF